MDRMAEWVYIAGIVFVFFNVVRLAYRKFIWRRDRKKQRYAAEEFKAKNEPVWRLADKNITSLARLLRRESLNAAVTNQVLHQEDIDPQVYRVFDYILAEKDWLFSNSAATVSNMLNGFELFIPGMVRGWLRNAKPKSIDIAFYKDIAIFVGSANELDLFREQKSYVPLAPESTARQTPIETWCEAPACCTDLDMPPTNGGRLIRVIEDEKMVLFKDGNLVNGHMFIIGASGVFSLVLALLGAAIVLELSQSHFLSKLSYIESFLIFLPIIWTGMVTVFQARERFGFRHKTIIFLDRKTSNVYLNIPGKSGLKLVPWNKLMVRVSSQAGYLVGTPYTASDNKLEFFSMDDPRTITAEFCAGSLFGGLGVWSAISMFMNGQINSTLDITPYGVEYRQGDPQKDGLYLLKRRIKTTFPALSLPAKALHLFLFLLTLGPLPYVMAERASDARVGQAFKLFTLNDEPHR